MCSIGLKSELQVGLFLRLNTAVRSKSISNSYTTEYFRLINQIQNSIKTIYFKVRVLHFKIQSNWGHWLSNLLNYISFLN